MRSKKTTNASKVAKVSTNTNIPKESTPLRHIDQLTYEYPSQEDAYFQSKITNKKEFATLALPKEIGPVPARGEYYNHQKLDSIFMQIWNFLLLDNEPGTGKTGAGWAIGEFLRSNVRYSSQDAYTRGYCNWISKMYIIVPGSTIERNWRTDYAKHSTLTTIPPFYHFDHHQSFYNKYSKYDAEDLHNELANCLFYIDEVHEMLGRSKKPSEKRMYEWYRYVFNVVPNIKIVLATGTPIIMQSLELGLIINLFPNMDMPLNEEWYDNVTEEELESYIRGKISYVRNRLKKAVITWPEESILVNEHSEIRVVPVEMSKTQTKEYMIAFKEDKDSFYTKSMMKSLISLNVDAINTNKLENPKEKNNYAKVYACKQYKMMEFVSEQTGVKFIFCTYIGGGVDVTAALLKSMGYEEYTGKEKNSNEISRGKRFAVIRASMDRANQKILELERRPDNLDGEFLEIILTSDVGKLGISLYHVQTVIVLNPMRHVSDEHQLDSRIFRPESYDALYTRNIKNGMTPEDAVVKVMFYRLVAIPDLSDIATTKGGSVKKKQVRSQDILDPYKNSVDWIIYDNNIIKNIPLEKNRMYEKRIAFDAQLHYDRNQGDCISPEDPNLVDEVNVGEYDKCRYGFFDPTPEDLGLNKQLREDTETYNLLHGQNEANSLILELITALQQELSVDIDDFWNRRSRSVSKLVFYRRLKELINGNNGLWEPILTIYGQNAYLRNVGNTVFIETEETNDVKIKEDADEDEDADENAPNESSEVSVLHSYPDTAIYANIHSSTIESIKTKGLTTIRHFSTLEELQKFLDADYKLITIQEKLSVIESILVTENEGNQFYDYVWERFEDKAVFRMKKPDRRIKFLSKIDDPSIRAEVPLDLITNITTDTYVTLHILRSQYEEDRGTKYNIAIGYSNVKTIAVLNRETHKFDVLQSGSAEHLVYAHIIKRRITEPYDNFTKQLVATKGEKGKIYGLVYDPELRFKVYDARIPPTTTKTGKINKSTRSRGRNCDTCNTETLIDYAVFLGLYPKGMISQVSTPKSARTSKPNKRGKKKSRESDSDDDLQDSSNESDSSSGTVIISDADLDKGLNYWLTKVEQYPNLNNIVNKNEYFYKSEENLDKLILFVKWNLQYMTKEGSNNKGVMRGIKDPICDMIHKHLEEENQVYSF